MNKLSENLKGNIRRCTVDIVRVLDNLESELYIKMDSDIEVAGSYDEASEFTRCTCYETKAKFDMLCTLELIDHEERNAMEEYADLMRKQKLEAIPEEK